MGYDVVCMIFSKSLVFKLNKDTKDKALDLFLSSLAANQLEHYKETTGI